MRWGQPAGRNLTGGRRWSRWRFIWAGARSLSLSRSRILSCWRVLKLMDSFNFSFNPWSQKQAYPLEVGQVGSRKLRAHLARRVI